MNNIVFTCHRLASSEKRIWIELAGPACSKLVRRDGKPLSPSVPKEYVETETWYDWNDEEFEDIRILDLGEVFSQGENPPPCVLPAECRAPEIIFEDSFDHRTDLWQAGCAVRPTLDLVVQVAVLTVSAQRYICWYSACFLSRPSMATKILS